MPFMSRYEILQLLHAHMYLLMCLNILNIPSFPSNSSYLVLNHFLPFIWDLQLKTQRRSWDGWEMKSVQHVLFWMTSYNNWNHILPTNI